MTTYHLPVRADTDATHPLDKLYEDFADEKIKPAPAGIVLRRMSLHLRGTIPTVTELADYEQTPEEMRQLRYAVAYLRDPDFAHYWGTYFGSIFREHTNERGGKFGSFYEYLSGSLHANKPYNQMVTEMLTATGSPDKNPAVNWTLRDDADPLQLAEYTGRVFLGKRYDCARCHDHPYYSDFKRRDYYELAAFFSQQYATRRYDKKKEQVMGMKVLPWNMVNNLASEDQKKYKKANSKWHKEYWKKLSKNQRKAHRKRTELAYNTVIYYPELGLRYPVTDDSPGGDLVEPEFPDGTKAKIEPGEDRRKVLAQWITSKDNEAFRKVMINRIWTRLMGWSFFTPFDDWNDDTDVQAEEILDHLDQVFVEKNYRIKDLILYIVTSKAYARSFPEPGSDEQKNKVVYFQAERMDADQLMNSLIQGSFAMTVRDIRERKMVPIQNGKLMNIDLRGSGSLKKPIDRSKNGYTNAAEVPRPVRYNTFLAVFGSGPRIDVADDEKIPTIEQVMTLINGRMTSRLANSFGKNDSYIRQEYNKTKSMDHAYGVVFRSLLSRNPTETELNRIKELTTSRLAANSGGYNQEALQDLIWALFNSQEFLHVN